MKRTENIISSKKVCLFFCLSIFLVIFASFSGPVVAKYIKKTTRDELYSAKEFYFTSDYLQPAQSNGEYVLYTLQEGVDTLSFELRNYADKLRTSQADIKYQVSLNGEVKRTGEITQEEKVDTLSFSGLETGKIYTVIATAKSPYYQTIGARFKLVSVRNDINVEAYGSNDSPVLQLTVRTNNYNGNIKISWGAGIYPDKTDPMLVGAPYGDQGNSVVVNLPSNAEYTFLFFKSTLNTPTNITAETTSEEVAK